MSQFIFDQIYGSQAKKKKIMQNNQFLYYRQMMKIKFKHANNQSLYKQLYLPQNSHQTIERPEVKKNSGNDIFLTLNQNSYLVQKINSHQFRILKKRNKSSINNAESIKNNAGGIKNWAHQRGYSLDSNRKLETRTIDSDAKRLRNYLLTHQKSKPQKIKLKNLSFQFEGNQTARTQSKFQKTVHQGQAFQSINKSDFSFQKY